MTIERTVERSSFIGLRDPRSNRPIRSYRPIKPSRVSSLIYIIRLSSGLLDSLFAYTKRVYTER